MTNFSDIIRRLNVNDFIPDPNMAAAAGKLVIGIFATHLNDVLVHRISLALPEAFSAGRLRAEPPRVAVMQTVDSALHEVAIRFNLDFAEARHVVNEVLGIVKEAVGRDDAAAIELALPQDWRALFEAV